MVTTTNLVSYWKLDEASGTLEDSHGSNDGTNNGATYGATGKINDCLDFDGSSDYVSCGDLDIAVSSGKMSISMWINPDSVSGGQWLIAEDHNSGGRNFAFGLNGDKLQLQVNGVGPSASGTTSISTGSWQHVAIVFDHSTNNGTYYVNGSAGGTFTCTGNFTASTAQVNIGRRSYSGAEQEFDGLIDEVAIWDGEILSSSDISDLYNSGSGLAYPFTSDVTINPSTLTLSTTSESPTYFLDISAGALTLNATLLGGNVGVPITFNATTLTVISELLTPRKIGIDIDLSIGPGTKGTRFVNKNYPVETGLENEDKHIGRIINLVGERNSSIPIRNRVLV